MKTKILIIALIGLSVVGCSKDESRTVQRIDTICNDESIDKRAEFILQCISNANPKSDEEPEDWIHKCRQMAERTYCDKKSVTVKQFIPKHGFWRDVKITVND